MLCCFRPSILSLDTDIYPLGCHLHPSFSYGTTRAPFGLSRCPSLVWACLWSIVVRMWFILEGHRDHFPSRSHHLIGRKWGHPDALAQLEFIGAC